MALVVALQLLLVGQKGINWDEFFHLTQLYRFREGALVQPLQTFWVRPLQWVLDVEGTSVDHIVIVRHFMLAAALTTAAGIFAIARRFAGTPAALLCALAYMTAGYVFTQAFAYRTDPLAAACLIWVMWIAGCERLGWAKVLVGAMLTGLAGLFTIKSAFWIVPIGGYALYAMWSLSRDEQIARLMRLGVLAGGGAMLFALALAAHGAGLPVETGEASAQGLNSAGSVVFSEGLFPQGRFLLTQLGMGLPFAILAVLSVGLWWRSDKSARTAILLAGLYGMLLSVAVYRNAYPYFYVFILPPVAIALAPYMQRVVSRQATLLYATLFAANAAILFMLDPAEPLPNQRAVQDAVREVFPEPVTYIDFSGHIGDYPRAADFMLSGWGLQKYRAQGTPVISERAAEVPIPLLLNNHGVIETALTGREAIERLLPEDARFIRENYVPHWGPMLVAGKRIAANQRVLHVEIPGTYTLEGAHVRIGGRDLAEGDTIDLARGTSVLEARSDALLRWGDHLPQPSMAAPTGAMMSNY